MPALYSGCWTLFTVTVLMLSADALVEDAQMAGLGWMVVTLAVLLSAGHSVAVDQNQLATIVQQVLNK